MRKIVEILRLARERGWSIRQIAESVGVPHNRLVHHAHRITLSGGSLRRLNSDTAQATSDD